MVRQFIELRTQAGHNVAVRPQRNNLSRRCPIGLRQQDIQADDQNTGLVQPPNQARNFSITFEIK